ncbi:hypothetical protein [Paenibacillus macquariensis]|nr:hypothetical protein [Paenibacillus macquariensis]MEC0090226.1 hypothetical protein [Paenibacillus macquariensis]
MSNIVMYLNAAIIEYFDLLDELHNDLLQDPLICNIEVQQIHYLFFEDLDVSVQVFFFVNML